MVSSANYKLTFSEVHKLLRLYLTVPLTSATSERAFSTLRRLLTYLRSSVTEQMRTLDLVDSTDLVAIARSFTSLNDKRRHYFGSFY